MKTRNGPTGDGDKTKREQFSGEDRPLARAREHRYWLHVQLRQDKENSQRQQRDGPQFNESAEIIARSEQQPDRQHAGCETVEDNGPRDVLGPKCEVVRQGAMAMDELSTPDSHQQQDNTDG